jgi:hypothetical protein
MDRTSLEGGRPPEAPRIELTSIDAKLKRLRVFETDLKNPEVDRAQEAIRRVFRPHLDWFHSREIAITYHGSLQFHDPVNLDIDVALLGQSATFAEVDPVLAQVENEFTKPGVWPRSPAHTDIVYISMEQMQRHLKRIPSDTPHIEGRFIDVSSDLIAATAISSLLVFPEQQDLFTGMDQQARKIMSQHRWLREGVEKILDHAIEVRLERRNKPQK